MKKLLLILCLVFMAQFAIAADYTAITKNNEVSNIKEVVVKEIVVKEVNEEREYSIATLESQIARIQKKIDDLEADKEKLVAIKAKVEVEAGKVILKK